MIYIWSPSPPEPHIHAYLLSNLYLQATSQLTKVTLPWVQRDLNNLEDEKGRSAGEPTDIRLEFLYVGGGSKHVIIFKVYLHSGNLT